MGTVKHSHRARTATTHVKQSCSFHRYPGSLQYCQCSYLRWPWRVTSSTRRNLHQLSTTFNDSSWPFYNSTPTFDDSYLPYKNSRQPSWQLVSTSAYSAQPSTTGIFLCLLSPTFDNSDLPSPPSPTFDNSARPSTTGTYLRQLGPIFDNWHLPSPT